MGQESWLEHVVRMILNLVPQSGRAEMVGVPPWVWVAFLSAFGCCVGSFLNVVIYRLPRELSLVYPGSACPRCGRHIHFYDNIPLVSWLLLRAKCRYCREPISPRYFIVELLTGAIFAGLYLLYFHTDLNPRMVLGGGWFVYLLHIVLLGALIAASGIDVEFWVIPLGICWFATAAGVVGSAVGPLIVDPGFVHGGALLPTASATTGALAAGATVGLGIGLLLLKTGLVKRSYEVPAGSAGADHGPADNQQTTPGGEKTDTPSEEPRFNHRVEALREILFLLPIVACSAAAYALTRQEVVVKQWSDLCQMPVVAGLLGSAWGYFVGCGVVWATRILGTLGFGKEAMGLGDVHLMGAAGAVLGALPVVLAFFVAPFFGLAWACFQMFFKKVRQIPYGPFLSAGLLTVMIFYDWILLRYGFFFRY